MGFTTTEDANALNAATEITRNVSATEDNPVHELPEHPVVTIEPRKIQVTNELRDLWAYRELLYFLTWRDVKVRYKQTALGIAWVILQPLASTIIFTIFLGILARVPSNGVPYPLLVYAGLLPWTFFATALSGAAISLVGNAHLITKTYFPRLIIPISGIAARLPDFAIALLILIGMMIYYRVPLTANILIVPILVVMLVFLTLSLGLFCAALNVKYRDVGVILPVLIQLGMFVSPVVYSTTLVPARWRPVYSLNPMVGIIDGFRAALIGQPFNWPALVVSVVATTALLTLSTYVFRGVERGFADIV